MKTQVAGFDVLDPEKPKINERGNRVTKGRSPYEERYIYDFKFCLIKNGWKQYDTSQDAPYFGVWVNTRTHVILTYCEGDFYIVECLTEEGYHAELADMARCYGPLPPCARSIDFETGEVTDFFDERPT